MITIEKEKPAKRELKLFSVEEYRSIIRHAAEATLQDFVQQVVNLSESLEGAEMEEMED